MIAISSFLDRIHRELDRCPQPIMVDAVRDAARQFCTESQVWRETVDDISTIKNTAEYDIEPPAKSRCVAIIGLTHHGLQLRPKSERELDDLSPNWRALYADTGAWFVSDTPETLRLVPYPSTSETNALKNVRVALQPTHDADQLPDILHRDYIEQIGFGALERLFRIPKKDWTNFDLATFYEKKFRSAIGSARIRALKNYQNSNLSARPVRLPGAP